MGCCSGGVKRESSQDQDQGKCSSRSQPSKSSVSEEQLFDVLNAHIVENDEITTYAVSAGPLLGKLEIQPSERIRVARVRSSGSEDNLVDSLNCSSYAPFLRKRLVDCSDLAAGMKLAMDRLAERGVLDAEKILLSLAQSFKDDSDITSLSVLRSSQLYQSVLQSANCYEQSAGQLLESLDGWDLIKTFRVPYRGPFKNYWPTAIGEKGDICQFFSKISGRTINIKVLAESPALHPELASYCVLGYVGMWHELDLWKTWHPAIVGDGPTPLRSMTKDHNLWEQCSKITLPPLRMSQIIDNHNFFDIDEGIFYSTQEVVLDEERLTSLNCPEPPKGFRRAELHMVIKNMVVCQETSNAICVGVTVDLNYDPPKWLINLLCGWFVPLVGKNLYDTGMGVMSSPPYVERFKRDTQGLYNHLEKLAEAGKCCERRRGFKHRPGLHASMEGLPSPSLLTAERQFSLNAFERTLDQELSGPLSGA